MTLLVAWSDEYGWYMCADSAATHSSPPMRNLSSFGEIQNIEDRTVEESAIKILELPRGYLTGISGEVAPAMAFIRGLSRFLRHTQDPLFKILDTLAPSIPKTSTFTIFLMDASEGDTRFCAISPDGGSGYSGDNDRRIAIAGSMPDSKRRLIRNIIEFSRTLPLSSQERLASVLVALQAQGITDPLVEHGIGGAFFGAHLSHNGISWQPDISYVSYRPHILSKEVITQDDVPLSQIGSFSETGSTVRVLVRDGIGIVVSTVDQLVLRAYVPPTIDRPREELEQLIRSATSATPTSTADTFPPLPIVKSKHYGFLNIGHPNALYASLRNESERPIFDLQTREGRPILRFKPELVHLLSRETEPGKFDYVLLVEDGSIVSMGKVFDRP